MIHIQRLRDVSGVVLALGALGVFAAFAVAGYDMAHDEREAARIVAISATAAPPDDLVLGSGTYTVAAFRAQTRAALLLPGAADMCAGFRGLTDAEIAAAIVAAQSEPTVQAPREEDRERAAGVVREECERIAR